MQTALVTGASSGIGEAIARQLLADGYRVYAAARRVDRMADLVPLGAKLLSLDVTDEASMVAAVETIRAAEGRLDVLVNNAGYGSYGSLEEVPIDEGRRQFEVNVFGLARLTQLALPVDAGAGERRDRQHLVHRRQDLRAVRQLVSRDEIRRRRHERQSPPRARAASASASSSSSPAASGPNGPASRAKTCSRHSGAGPYAKEAQAHARVLARGRHFPGHLAAGGGGAHRLARAPFAPARVPATRPAAVRGRSCSCARSFRTACSTRCSASVLPRSRASAAAASISARVGKLGCAPWRVQASDPAIAAPHQRRAHVRAFVEGSRQNAAERVARAGRVDHVDRQRRRRG